MQNKYLRNIVFIIMSIVLLSFKDNTDFTLIKSIKGPVDFINVDNLGNLYIVNDNKLIKLDNNGNVLYNYESPIDGDITLADVTNSMKILLFYKDFARIKYLDNTLSVKGNYIALQDLSLDLCSMACSSYQNSVWIFDPISYQLYRINEYLQITQSSGNIIQLTGHTINPTFMAEYDNALYVSDKDKGIIIFDLYGGYIKTLPFKNINNFQFYDNKLIYNCGDTLKSLDLKQNNFSQIVLADKQCLSVKVGLKRLFVMNKEGVNIYQTDWSK